VPGMRADLRAVCQRLGPHVRRRRGAILAGLALALITAGLGAVHPLLIKMVFDGFSGPDPRGTLLTGCALAFGLVVLRQTLSFVQARLSYAVRRGLDYGLRREIVARLQRLPVAFHAGRSPALTVEHMNRGIDSLIGVYFEGVSLVSQAAFLATSIWFMWTLDGRLALILLTMTPLPVLIGALSAPEQTRRARWLAHHWSALYARLHETLSGVATVRSFGREGAERRRFLLSQNEGLKVVSRGVKIDAAAGGMRSLVVDIAGLVPIAVGGWFVVQGDITVGTIAAFGAYVGGLFGPVQSLTGVYQTLRKGRVGLELLGGILEAPESVTDRPDALPCPVLTGRVEFDRVTFGYEEGGPVLRDLSLCVEPGQTIALVGPSGSGKTTILDLLLRLRDPQNGSVRVDGMDLRDLRQVSYRRQVGVVRQDAFLFNDTVAANLAYGRPSATRAEIEASARAANAHEFISALPDGYDTVLGDRGSRLSGGQRQRLAIARALLVDPAILLLDEATSALDAESESLVQAALDRLREGRTTFVVAHRLSTAMCADRILVLQDGAIVEDGTHQSLVRSGGIYASLVQLQAGGLLIEARAA
jgi:ATP-binding cassette, subfamily B, bacterial